MMKIDFRTKFFMAMVVCTVSVSGSLQQKLPLLSLFVALFPFLCLLSERRYGMFAKGSLMMLTAWLFEIFLPKDFKNPFFVLLHIAAAILLRMVPGMMAGYYAMMTTTMSDMVCSFKKMHLPDALIIPISVMFRFFYSVREDYRCINEAMKMHGLGLRAFFRDPVRILEFKLVPLLICSARTADDVAVCAMTRGMVPGQKRSSISNARLRMIDFVLLFLFGLIFCLQYLPPGIWERMRELGIK